METSKIIVPELSLVLLVGPSGAGKSTFARKHFRPTEILTSDYFRALVRDDETDQSATKDAFEVLHLIAAKRLAAGRLTVIDATNVQAEARRPLLALARQYHCLPVAVVLNFSEKVCWERTQGRSDRKFGPHVVRQQSREMRRALKTLKREGFTHVYVLSTPEEVENAVVERQPLWTDRRGDHGPFDIIGDVHGCADELEQLLHVLGYEKTAGAEGESVYAHPQGRKAVFLGDLVDRGPRTLDTVRIVRGMVKAGTALCVPGNHDMKLLRKLRGKDVQISHGLERTLAEIDALPEAVCGPFVRDMIDFFDGLISHYVLDDGRLVVAHAGLKEEMQGRGSRKVRDFALYGETTGETDAFGLPVRHNWAADYRGRAMVVYGHTPVPEPEWLNRTINIDTGCVFGGKLTALRYPERELVAVPAARTYAEPVRPFLPPQPQAAPITAQQEQDDVLDMEDVLGKRIISTRLRPATTIREENAAAALEGMSRFAVNPKWLIYLPPGARHGWQLSPAVRTSTGRRAPALLPSVFWGSHAAPRRGGDRGARAAPAPARDRATPRPVRGVRANHVARPPDVGRRGRRRLFLGRRHRKTAAPLDRPPGPRERPGHVARRGYTGLGRPEGHHPALEAGPGKASQVSITHTVGISCSAM